MNKWSKLPVGGVRYGVMCADDGGRSTTVSPAGQAGPLSDVDHVVGCRRGLGGRGLAADRPPEWAGTCTPVTTAYASMNLAGPRSRELLAWLTDVDLDPESFGYMQVRTGTVAGIEDCVPRADRVHRRAYEIHVPASYGCNVWGEALRGRR
ncbi:hypothetical protein HBB16_15320 [Pseudonocardia sp. MCCB 268]|nr:hypothetical protein [Pseudonocardia cytotoxica]